MQNSAGSLVATTNTTSHQLIAADLRFLIAQVETSMRLIEAATAPGDELSGSSDVFVLDDVTPHYATASAALEACKSCLGLALQSLSESD